MIERTTLEQCVRADCYKILAECYYLPEHKLLEQLEEFGQVGAQWFGEVLRSAPTAEDLDSHEVDYSRLFVGPFKLLAPPYGSVYLEDGKFMGNSTLDAKGLYEREGLDIVVKDAPDHISVELEFMYYLAIKEADARQNSDIEEAGRLHGQQVSFLQTHLGSWVEAFADRVEENAQTEFYKALARATRDFVLADLDRLSGDCESGTVES